jgi:hypothetical protein
MGSRTGDGLTGREIGGADMTIGLEICIGIIGAGAPPMAARMAMRSMAAS